MNYSEDFLSYLKSDNIYCKMNVENRVYDIVKFPYSSALDLLFMTYNYDCSIQPSNKLECCGFYDKENNKLYNPDYYLRKDILNVDWDDPTYPSMTMLTNEFNLQVTNAINDYVMDERKSFYESAGEYESNVRECDVYENFINNKGFIKYNSNYVNSNEKDILEFIDKGQDYVFDKALDYFETNKEYIGKKLIDIDKSNEFLESINNNKNHPLHKRKEIVNCIKEGNYGNVHVFINKNNIDFDFKFDASIIENSWNYSSIYSYRMPAPDCRDFENLFGKHTDFEYDNIVKLEYRNKIVYEDKNFNKENTMEEEKLEV